MPLKIPAINRLVTRSDAKARCQRPLGYGNIKDINLGHRLPQQIL